MALGPQPQVVPILDGFDGAAEARVGLVPATPTHVVHGDPRQHPGHVASGAGALDDLEGATAPAVGQPGSEHYPREAPEDEVGLRELELGPCRLTMVQLAQR